MEYSTSNQPEAFYPFDAIDDGSYRMCLRNTGDFSLHFLFRNYICMYCIVHLGCWPGGSVRRVTFQFEKAQNAASINEVAKKKDLEPVEVHSLPLLHLMAGVAIALTCCSVLRETVGVVSNRTGDGRNFP